MPIPALLAPALISIGVKLAGKAIKSMLKPSDAQPPQISKESFDKLLKEEQNRPVRQVAVAVAPAIELLPPSDLIARLGHDQGVRSLALGLQSRLRVAGAPSPAGADPQRFSLAGRLAGKLHLDSIA